MEKEEDRVQSFARRAFIVGAFQGGLLAVLGGRLAWLQISQGERYQTLAESNRINTKMLAPSRGQIVDRYGVPLAVNNQNFRVLVIPEQTENLQQSLTALSRMIPLKEDTIRKIIQQAKKSRAFTPLEVEDDLDWEQVAKIEVNLPDLPGVSIDVGEQRNYPFGEATAHLIGYVSAASKADQAKAKDPLLTLPGFRVGKGGIEKVYDADLRGQPGSADMEVNVLGREVRELKNFAGTPGKRVSLSIDAELQRYTQLRLSDTKSASAVIMDAHTGAVYALASFPSFDPNHFTNGIPAEKWEELLADPAVPLTNKALAGQYPPGSTFKMVTALAGLESGKINASTTAFCPGHYTFGDTRFHCWKPNGHGNVNLVSALEQSCDTYFYKMAIDVGVDRIGEMANKLGLGHKTGFDLTEERPGLVPTVAWKRGQLGQPWHPGETIVTSIGQGYNLTTPLQLAVMTSRLVNGGKEVKPWVTGFVGDHQEKPTEWPEIGINPYHLELVKRGMDRVVNGERGTARGAQIKEEGFEMGGKTGTAQVKRITKQERAAGIKNETLPWKFRHHALFVGYAPADKPRYVCSVVVEHGGGGSAVAAPVARDLLLMAQKRNPAGTPISVPGDEPVMGPFMPPEENAAEVKEDKNG